MSKKIDRLKKYLELVDRGEGGERDSAAERVKELLLRPGEARALLERLDSTLLPGEHRRDAIWRDGYRQGREEGIKKALKAASQAYREAHPGGGFQPKGWALLHPAQEQFISVTDIGTIRGSLMLLIFNLCFVTYDFCRVVFVLFAGEKK